jgi:hypothetical protein
MKYMEMMGQDTDFVTNLSKKLSPPLVFILSSPGIVVCSGCNELHGDDGTGHQLCHKPEQEASPYRPIFNLLSVGIIVYYTVGADEIHGDDGAGH